MGDLAAAKRNMMWVKEAVSSARWDNYESSLNKVMQALDGVPEAEKAGVVAELDALKQEADKAQKAEKAKRVLRQLDMSVGQIDPRSLVDSALVEKIEAVLKRLASDEVTSCVEPDVIAGYRAKVEALRPAGAKPIAPPPPAAPPPAPTVDLSAARRELRWMKEAIGSARWDNYESSLSKVNQALAGVPDAAKADLVAELDALKQEAEKAQKAEKAKRVLRQLDMSVDQIDPRSLTDSALVERIEAVLKRLASDEVTSCVEPEVIATYRAKVEALRPAAKGAPPPAPKPAAAPAPQATPVSAPVAPRPAPAAAPPPSPAAQSAAPAFDLGPARRELRWVKDSIDSRNWGRAEEQISRAERALEGIPDDAKAPVVAEIAQLRKETAAGEKREKAQRLTDEIERRISGADPKYNAPDRVKSILQGVSERLDEDEVKQFLEPAEIERFRAKIASVVGTSAADEKARRVAKIEEYSRQFEEGFGSDPFGDTDDMQARRTYQQLASFITNARNNLSDLDKSDADAKRFAQQLEGFQQKLDGAWADYEERKAVGNALHWFERMRTGIAGWDAETEGPSWEAFTTRYDEGLTDLKMPKSRGAIRDAGRWIEQSQAVIDRYPQNAGLQAAAAEARKIVETATSKLHRAFETMMAEGERAPLPTEKKELEKPQKVVQYVSSWFEKTPHLEANDARAKKLQERWTAHLEELDRQGAELYAKLEAEAQEKWPAILAATKAAGGFDPRKLAEWQGKTVHIVGWNRSGWDFAGDFNFANRIEGVPVAGDWNKRIGAALRDAVERTRKSIDDHKDWDLVAVVKGTGEVKRRTHREWTVKETNEKFKTESWEPEGCVVIEIIAMRAGPVAIGPG
jgi:hypothetical protein